MELRYVALSDIGPFRGRHEFDMNSADEKTGFAIFSKNGRGKTSLFNAMQWCLFGAVYERGSVRGGKWSEGIKRPIVGDNKKKILMNRGAYEQEDIPEMSVIIIASKDDLSLQITRTAKSRVGSMPRHDEGLSIDLLVTVGERTATGKEGQALIEEMFPEELRRFFFIDGESLEEYVNLVKVGQVGGIKDDVEAVLRIPALTRGIVDIEYIRDIVWKEMDREDRAIRKSAKSANKAQEMKKEIDRLQDELDSKQTRYDSTKLKRDDLEEELRGLSEAQEHIEKLQSLRGTKSSLFTTVERSKRARVGYASNAWRVLIWDRAGPLHEKTNSMMGEIQNNAYKIDSAKKVLSELEGELSRWSGVCSHCNQDIVDSSVHKNLIQEKITAQRELLNNLQSGPEMDMTEVSTMLGDLAKLGPPSGSRQMILASDKNWLEDRSSFQDISEELEREEAKGLQGLDLGELTKKYDQRGLLRGTLNRMSPEIDEASLKVKQLKTEYNKMGGIKKKSHDRGMRGLSETLGILLNVLKDSVSEYREEARREVERIAGESFKNITNAPEALIGVIIDENFNGSIRGVDGRPHPNPSSGQEMTMTMCIMDALRQTSGVSAPIFFDTPGRSLDDDHKKSQLEFFWKLRDHQFVIFPHSGEYKIKETLDEFGGLIGGAWELTWPADIKKCERCDDTSPIKDGKIMKCIPCGYEWDTSVTETTVTKLEV